MSYDQLDRRELLERLGAFYGEQHFALVWTETNRARDADDVRPKRVTTKAWQTTLPLPHAARGKALMTSKGQSRNPGINLRTSNLVGIECDGEDDLRAVEELGLPPTLTERSSRPYKRHFYFRPPDELETLPEVSFRFEGGKLTSVGNNYYVCAPASHPSGATYEHVAGLGPGEVEIATMPADTYWALVARAEKADAEQRQRLQVDPGAKIREGNRRDTIFRYACLRRRWSSSEDVILTACLAYNEAHCEPPLTREQVEGQVAGAMKFPGGEELERTAPASRDDDIDLGEIPGDVRTHTPVADLGALLGSVEGFVRRFVVMSEAQAVAVTLWIAHTHVLDAFETTPYLSLTSATKRCGKSRLFDELELLVARPWKVVTPSEAVVFRKIEADKPTLLLDEIDAIFKDKNGNTEPLRALLNAGNRRGTKVPRCVGPTMQLVSFNVFCAKALAGIGRLPDTIGDRSVEIKLARKAPSETAARFRRREASVVAEPLRTEFENWAATAIPKLERARPVVPEQLDDRAEEAWEPLLAIAELAGGAWPERVRRSALGLSTGDARDEDELGLRLLADCRTAFERAVDDRLFTSRLIELLAEDDEAPWGDWYGSAIKPRAVSRLLRPFGIRPRTIRIDESTAKGYHRDDFLDAWNRYPVVSDSVSVTSVTTAWLSQKLG